MLLYIWFLLTIPQDRLICSLWISQPPTPAALVQACGTDAIGAMHRLDVLYAGQVVCSKPGNALTWIQQDCTLSGPLSNYRINVIQPRYQTTLCSVTTPTNDKPSAEEIKRQCPDAKGPITNYDLRFAGTREADQPLTMCKPPAVDQPASIATTDTYHLLAGKLIWHGYAKANCPNGALNVETFAASPCGIEAARSQMLNWQNGLDAEILKASREWNVPAMTLKAIISKETQFWPWTGTDGEHGFIQITEDGAGLVLQQYQPGYYQLNPAERHQARIAWLKQLDCAFCSPVQSYDHAKRVMNLYAQSLAAYYCTYGSWESALRAWNINHQIEV
jgi:hypothetical protein